MDDSAKKENVANLLKKGVLLSPDFLEEVDANINPPGEAIVLDRSTSNLISQERNRINWQEIDKVRVLHEKGRAQSPELDATPETSKPNPSVQILNSHKIDPKKIGANDFVGYYKKRYELIERLLQNRPEVQNLTSIKRLKDSVTGNCSIIGIVNNVKESKSKNLVVEIEDSTGMQRVLISRNKSDLYAEARDIVTDEVIAVTGSRKENILFANRIFLPDIPNLDVKKSPVNEYLACMSDLHFGSKQFMPEEFNRFLSWVNQKSGSAKQKEIAANLKYIIIAGDIVDGIGVYENQFSELSITDVKEQYAECARYLAQIPEHVNIIISPGNHDAVRLSEPQPAFNTEFAEPLKKLKNVSLVSNPGTVRIGANKDFPGFNCLVYHGYSFDHYVANVESIRQNGGYERADLIMRFLLKRRHLAPAHTSTLINPTPDHDALFIDTVPDFFITGHIHRTSISNYRATTLINSSCWQSMTSFQERLGHNPQPARLPLINLKTREASIINFCK